MAIFMRMRKTAKIQLVIVYVYTVCLQGKNEQTRGFWWVATYKYTREQLLSEATTSQI